MSWDNYYSKHCTRLYGWLPAGLEFKKRKGDNKLKYFTLCDVNAIDIFMFEMEGVLERDNNHALTGVTICEVDPGKITEIFNNVRPPLRESIVNGKVQSLLLFKDTEELRSLDPDGDVRNINKRRQLNMRRDALRLQNEFPFDIINFDPCDSLLHPEKEMFKAFDRLFEFQKGIDDFLIFSTSPISFNNEILKYFNDDFRQNLLDHQLIKDTATNELNTNDFENIGDDYKKMAIGFGKSLIAKLAIKHGFKSRQLGIYIYKSENGTPMLSSVTELTKSNDDHKTWYPDEISNIISKMPTVFSEEFVTGNEEVREHLQSVIQNREDIQKEFIDLG